jgi:uncharacterized protein
VKIVPDTNVLIASLISRGFCYELIEHSFLNHTLVTSEFILNEVEEKLIEKFKYSPETAEEAVALFRSRMEVVTPENLSSQVCRDPDDDNILATATAGNCECIVTGDKDLLVLKQYVEIKILSPREFSDQEDFE